MTLHGLFINIHGLVSFAVDLNLCHPEQARRSGATKGAPKDPDMLSPAIRIQGISTGTHPGPTLSAPEKHLFPAGISFAKC
jgi:hypothetical protein